MDGDTPADLYLDLLAKTLTRALFEDNDRVVGIRSTWWPPSRTTRALDKYLAPLLNKAKMELVRKRAYNREERENGRDWPARAETMAGLKRLANARFCIESVIADEIVGDIVETGVWRGGMSIFMRGVLKIHGVTDRKVWVADSFEGLPSADRERYPSETNTDFTEFEILSVGVDQVKRNFERYGLLDDQVEFLVGWFRDTLRMAPIGDTAVLRLDGDMYESTIQALEPLYPKLAIGGYCIIDDYGNIGACRSAVTDYRNTYGIEDEIIDIDGWGAFWQKSIHATDRS